MEIQYAQFVPSGTPRYSIPLDRTSNAMLLLLLGSHVCVSWRTANLADPCGIVQVILRSIRFRQVLPAWQPPLGHDRLPRCAYEAFYQDSSGTWFGAPHLRPRLPF